MKNGAGCASFKLKKVGGCGHPATAIMCSKARTWEKIGKLWARPKARTWKNWAPVGQIRRPAPGKILGACGAGPKARTWKKFGLLWGRAGGPHLENFWAAVGQGRRPAPGQVASLATFPFFFERDKDTIYLDIIKPS